MKIIITKSAGETKEFAKKIAAGLKSGDVLALVGDLGGGKTTFVKGLAKAFGVAEKNVQSPTFQLIKEYKVSDKRQVTRNKENKKPCPMSRVTCHISKIYHLDMYRVCNKKEAEELGLDEIFSDKNAISVIEWAEKIRKLLPPKTKWLEFDFMDEKTRKIILK